MISDRRSCGLGVEMHQDECVERIDGSHQEGLSVPIVRRFYSKAATRRGPTHNARNYSRRAEIQFARARRAAARARPDATWRSRTLRARPRQPAETRFAQFGLAFVSDQPNNRLRRVQK